MKKIKSKTSLLGLVLVCLACSKEKPVENQDSFKNLNPDTSIENQVVNYFNTPFNKAEEVIAYIDAMKDILVLARNSEFRSTVFEQTLLQKNGDYVVTFENLNKAFKRKEKYRKVKSKKTINLNIISEKIIQQTHSKPTLFFPRAETLEKKIKKNKISISSKDLSEPIAVFKNVYDENYNSPGYILDENNNLVFSKMINEEYGWTHDVYVIGNQESLVAPIPEGPEEGGSSGGGGTLPPNTTQYRYNNRPEYAGLIQIKDINAIEHWTAGKLEMRIVVISEGTGGVVYDRQMPKRARNNFDDNAWYNYDDLIFYWNKAVIGDYTIENWIEVDGGGSATITINIPNEEGGPSTSVKIPVESKDDKLGKSIVQFTDPLYHAYTISYMSFKRY